MLEQVAGPDRLTLYGSFTSSSSYKPMLYLALARLPFSFRTVNLKTGVQNSARIPRGQPLGRGAVIAPPRPDDPAIERDPRLPGARDRAFRGPTEQERWQAREWLSWEADHITAVARVRHCGPVPQDASRGHRRVPAARRGGTVVCRQDGARTADSWSATIARSPISAAGAAWCSWPRAGSRSPTGRISKPGRSASRRCPASRCPTI